jgi:chromosome segregation ATPase
MFETEGGSGGGGGGGGNGSGKGSEPDDKDKEISRLNREAQGLRSKLRETESKLEDAEGKLTKASEDAKKASDDARAAGMAEGKKESEKEHAAALASAEVRARAARHLADPEDAPKFLDLDALVDNGKVNGEKVDKALAELVEKKPYLAIKAAGQSGSGDGGGQSNRGNGDGGARHSAPQSGDSKMDSLIRGQIKR